MRTDEAYGYGEKYEPPPGESPDGHTSGKRNERERENADRRPSCELEWAADIQPREGEWIVKGVLPASGLASIYGPSRAGKSFLALDWAMRIACGDNVLDFKTRRCGVAIIGAEAPEGIRKRIRACIKENSADGLRIPLALIAFTGSLSVPDSPDVQSLIEELQAEQETFRVEGADLGVVIVDTFARATPGSDENSGADMGAALAALERIGRELGVLVIAVHHVGKNAAAGLRGHSSIFAALDTAIEVTLDDGEGLRRVRVAKQKDSEDGAQWAFRLKQVELGCDSDGDAVTSCVVAYVDAPASATKSQKKITPPEAIVLEALKAVLSLQGRRPPPGVPCPKDCYAAPAAAVREHAYKIGLAKDGDKPSTPRMRFSRAQEGLCASRRIYFWQSEAGEAWLWLA